MTSHLDKAFLIDVSEEDDSLLPVGDSAMLQNADDQQHSSSGQMECTAEAADAIQKDDLLCQQALNGIPEELGKLALPVITEEPVLVKKKKKMGFNVRKSLAWNSAFFTEEESKENLIGAAVSSPPSTGSLTGSVPNSSEHHVINGQGSDWIRHGVIAPISVANVHRDTSKKEKALAKAHANSESKLLPRRSLEKKDQVFSLPGVNRYNGEDCLSLAGEGSAVRAATAFGSVTSNGATHFKQILKDSRLINQSSSKEPMRQSSLMKLTGDSISSAKVVPHTEPALRSMKLISETAASMTTQHTTKNSTSLKSGTFAGRDKPSGLRMPSPKLGFFDTSRTACQVPVPCERTGHGGGITGLQRSSKDVEIGSSRYSTNQAQGLKHPAALAEPSNHLPEASRQQMMEARSSSRTPCTHVHGHSAGVAAMRVPPTHELSRSILYLSNTESKKFETEGQVLQARKNGQNQSLQEKQVRSRLAPSTVQKCQESAQNVPPSLRVPGSQLLSSSFQTLLGQENGQETMVVSWNQSCNDTQRDSIFQTKEVSS